MARSLLAHKPAPTSADTCVPCVACVAGVCAGAGAGVAGAATGCPPPMADQYCPATNPCPGPKPPTPKPGVRVMTVETRPHSFIIKGEGTVKPLREIQLVPEVSGKVIYVSPSMVDGGEFKKDDVLLRIDPVDYQLAVTLARARIKDSESKLKFAEEEAAAAKE